MWKNSSQFGIEMRFTSQTETGELRIRWGILEKGWMYPSIQKIQGICVYEAVEFIIDTCISADVCTILGITEYDDDNVVIIVRLLLYDEDCRGKPVQYGN